ncbi:MAG: hypothetical protein L0216_06295 [Planctomycetales bacterium]|nr:hypothetical protein [Planctomycetales bacterium]
MRMMVRFSLDVAAANAAIKNGTLPKVIEATMNDLKPEAAYFYAEEGRRTAYMVFDMKDPSQIPGIAEPWFMGMNALVTFRPVMNIQDLKAGLEKAMKKLG